MQRKKKKAVQTSKPGVKKKLSWLHSIAEISPECGVCGRKPSCHLKRVKSCKRAETAQGTTQLEKAVPGCWNGTLTENRIRSSRLQKPDTKREVIELLFKMSKSFKVDFIASKIILFFGGLLSYFGTMWFSFDFLDEKKMKYILIFGKTNTIL